MVILGGSGLALLSCNILMAPNLQPFEKIAADVLEMAAPFLVPIVDDRTAYCVLRMGKVDNEGIVEI